jgi:hypothetical protein
VGLVPRAGRLRRADGLGEEYVDAWVFYKDFFTDEGKEAAGEAELAGGRSNTDAAREQRKESVEARLSEDTRTVGRRSIAKL